MNKKQKEKLNKAVDKMLESDYALIKSAYAAKIWNTIDARIIACNIVQENWREKNARH